MGNKTKPKLPKDGATNPNSPSKVNAEKGNKKKHHMMNTKNESPDPAENDDKATSAHQMLGSSNSRYSSPQRNSRIARVQMDGSIAYSEDEDRQQQQSSSPSSKTSPKSKGSVKKKERIVIDDPKLAKKIAKYQAKKERKRKRRELFRRGPIKRTFSHDSLGDMSKSTIENLYGPVSVSGTTSRNLSPSSADPSVSILSKSPGVGSLDLDSDNDWQLEESGGYNSSSSGSDNDDLLQEAVTALEKYQNTHLSGQTDTDDDETDGSMDNDDNNDDASGNPTDTVQTRRSSSGNPTDTAQTRKSLPGRPTNTDETRRSTSRTSGVLEKTLAGEETLRRGPVKIASKRGSAKKPDNDFIIKHIKRQASRQTLQSNRTSSAIDVDGHNASNAALDLLNFFPPEQIEINEKEQDCVSIDISLDLDLEEGIDQDQELGKLRHEMKPRKGKHVDPSESPSKQKRSPKRKNQQKVKSKQQNVETPVENDVPKSDGRESRLGVKNSGLKTGTRCLILFGLIVLLMGGLTALILWILSKKGIIDISHDQNVEAATPPVQPPVITSLNYTLVSKAVQTDFGNSTFSRLQDPSTPQAKAAIWFATEDTFLSFPLAEDVDSRKLFRQRYAMATLYYATDGPKSWHNQFDFLSPSHICDWTKSDGDIGGVFCLGKTVLGITLLANQLVGSIPDEIWALEDLEVLELEKNSINGSIPEGISRLSNLQTLSLSGNPLSGTLPSSLGLSANLTRLEVSDCDLTGQLPAELANTGLETLLLDGNGFVGTVPAAYTQLPLVNFAIQRNRISGDLTNTICSIGTLESATADCNVLCGCCEQCS